MLDNIRVFDHRGRIVLSQSVRRMMGLTDVVVMRVRPEGLLLIPYLHSSQAETVHTIRRFDKKDRIIIPRGVREMAKLGEVVELVSAPEGVLLKPSDRA